MTPILKALSALLTYPTAELIAAVPEIRRAAAEEAALPARLRNRLERLATELATGDIYDLQARYVLLFDRTRSLSLYLFEHVHGEGRDRGQAMVELQGLYAEHGLAMATPELPDFLPLFLEFLAALPRDEAKALLAEPAHILSALAERLRRRKSGYAAAFDALVAFGGDVAEAGNVEALLRQPDDDPNDLEALDRAWADAPVTFGPEADPQAGGCPKASDLLNRMGAAPPRPASPQPR